MEHVTRSDLIGEGMTDRQIRAGVDAGALHRLRRGHFARFGWDEPTARAIRVGGRLACLSELRSQGVWVLDSDVVHVHVDAHATRLRAAPAVRLHWGALVEPARNPSHVEIVDALIQAASCLDHRAWVASLDSALHTGTLHPSRLAGLARALPAGRRDLTTMADGRAESGLESIVRVLALDLGFQVRSQVLFRNVGRVDLVIEDWIAVETDGSAFHDQALSSWDRMRDARLFAAGMSVLRPGYSLVVHDQATVARQLIGAVASHRRVKNSGVVVARARRRARQWGFSGVLDRKPAEVSVRATPAPRPGSG